MRLRKEEWERVKLGDIFKLRSGNALPVSKHINGDVAVYGGNGIIGFHDVAMLEKSTIAIGRVGTPGTVFITAPNSWITDNALYPVEYYKSIDQSFLAILLNSLNLYKLAQKTAQPSISQSIICNIKTILPPIQEQKQIASLFQSLETALEKIEEQEKDLKSLQKELNSGLLSKEPIFGKLLSKKNYKLTNFGVVADCIEQHDKEKKNVKRFIGLENIESENLTISTWGDISKGTTFTKKFSKGDVLFGKRRAYLKKVAVADFDGICSGDILVIRAKENHMLSQLLPFYIMSEPFINHAVSTSAGSLSPRTKWKELAKLEFAIPDIQIQKTILNVFKQIQLVLTQLKEQKQLLSNLKQNLLNEIFG